MNHAKKSQSMAIFVDIENLIVGVGRLGLPIDIGRVISKLLEEYSDWNIRIRRAYGDIYAAVKQLQRHVGEENVKGLHAAIRNNLGENLIQIADTPYLKGKNSADMWMTVDALSIAHALPDIDRFTILSSDRDYIPLILKLRELGKEVIGFGIRSGEVNPLYVKACDSFYYYSSLFVAKETDEKKVIAVPPEETEDTESVRDTYIKLLVQAARILNQQGKPANGGRLVPIMKQLQPDYDPTLAGLNSSRDLAAIAKEQGLVELRPAGMDFEVIAIEAVNVQGHPAPSQVEPKAPVIDTANIESCVAAYRDFFQKKLGIDEIPDAHVRAEIFDETDASLTKVGGTDLDDLSHLVADAIGPGLASEDRLQDPLWSLSGWGVLLRPFGREVPLSSFHHGSRHRSVGVGHVLREEQPPRALQGKARLADRRYCPGRGAGRGHRADPRLAG